MTLKEFQSMLLGADIRIFTDHQNLTFNNFNTQRVLCWRCFVKEYSPKLFYLQGKLNVLADAFSRLPRFSDTGGMEGKNAASSVTPEPMDMMQFAEIYECLRELPEMDNYFAVSDHMLNLPASGPNPLDFEWLRDTQYAVPKLSRLEKGYQGYQNGHLMGSNWSVSQRSDEMRTTIGKYV